MATPTDTPPPVDNPDRCPCGAPIVGHYQSIMVAAQMAQIVREHGWWVTVHVPGQPSYWVPRHFIAAHGLKGWQIPRYARMYDWPESTKPMTPAAVSPELKR